MGVAEEVVVVAEELPQQPQVVGEEEEVAVMEVGPLLLQSAQRQYLVVGVVVEPPLALVQQHREMVAVEGVVMQVGPQLHLEVQGPLQLQVPL